MRTTGLVFGSAVGMLLGFLLRPSLPFFGQLSFGTVITRGSTLEGLNRLLVPAAEQSFNYLLVGTILGALIGTGFAVLLERKPAQAQIAWEKDA